MARTSKEKATERLRLSLRWLWAGPVIGIVCMIGLFIFGLVRDHPQLVVISVIIMAVLLVIWGSMYAAIRMQLTKLSSAL